MRGLSGIVARRLFGTRVAVEISFVSSLVFIEKRSDGSDVDAVWNKGAFVFETAFSAQVTFEVGAVHALALFAILHAQVERVGRLSDVHRQQQDQQRRHQDHRHLFCRWLLSGCYSWRHDLLGWISTYLQGTQWDKSTMKNAKQIRSVNRSFIFYLLIDAIKWIATRRLLFCGWSRGTQMGQMTLKLGS